MSATTPVALPDSAVELAALIDAAVDKLGRVSLSGLGECELLDVARAQQRSANRGVGVAAVLVREIGERNAHRVDGYLTVRRFLLDGLHVSSAEARRRLTNAKELTPHTALTGETLEPAHPATAAALAEGVIGGEHVDVISRAMSKIPARVDVHTRDEAEQMLAQSAPTLTPEQLSKVAYRVLAHLDPDGSITDDADRQRQRGLSLSAQDQRLMSRLSASLTPVLRAKLDVILAAWAAPGMNNPADPQSPRGGVDDLNPDDATLSAARDRDTRSVSQRNHDALEALCDYILGDGGLGAPTRLPAELVLTATVAELEASAGFAVTTTGAAVPITDLVKIAAAAIPHLAVFANHRAEVLYLGRGSRFANKSQRLALFGRDRGCTAPGCDRPFVQTEAHHLREWARGGRTNIDGLGAACGRHNRAVGDQPGQWETEIIAIGDDAGRVGWRPTGSREPLRVNPIHHTTRIGPTNPQPPPRGEIRLHQSRVETEIILATGWATAPTTPA